MKQDYLSFINDMKGVLIEKEIPNIHTHICNLDSYAHLSNYLNSLLFILDYRTSSFHYVSPNSEEIQGYSPTEVNELGPEGLMKKMHPEEADIITNHIFPEGNKAIKFIPQQFRKNLRVSFNYRFLQKNGLYVHLHQQFSTLLFDADSNPLVIMGTINRIETDEPIKKVICKVAYKGFLNKWFTVYKKSYTLSSSIENSPLSKVELEIIKLVSQGLTSKEIAEKTNKSVETIKTQRKKIISKTNCQNITDVVTLAIKNNWI